ATTRAESSPQSLFNICLHPLPPKSPLSPYPTLFRSRLAYVVTGDAQVDEISRMGLVGLSDFMNRRTAAALADPHAVVPGRDDLRSEEHTSELQSRENLVCRPLPEKKKLPIEVFTSGK